MPPEAQRDTIAFFPEVALEEDYPEVLDALEGLVAEGSEYLIPVLEATSNMALTDAMQTRVTQLVAARVQSCGVEDLPAVVRHLMQGIGSGKGSAAADALSTLRQALHFATPSDPRLAVPDRKQKQRVATCAAELPEARVLAAMRQAVQFGKGAADAVLKDVRGLTSPAQHRTFDFWLLLSTSALDADRRKGVLSVLRKKFGEGHAEPAWVERAVAGHSLALQEHFLELLVLAERLLADPGPAISAAGSVLCRGMFLEFKDPYRRQEVLLALHSHLGAAVPAEATTALGVLQSLARDATADLLEYAAFLTNILDYVTGYNDAQLAAAFDVFAELVTGTCTHGAATPDGMQLLSDPGEGRRTRMEDELFIFLRKQLSGALPAHRRVGAVGVVALVQRLARQMETDGEVETSESLLGKII